MRRLYDGMHLGPFVLGREREERIERCTTDWKTRYPAQGTN